MSRSSFCTASIIYTFSRTKRSCKNVTSCSYLESSLFLELLGVSLTKYLSPLNSTNCFSFQYLSRQNLCEILAVIEGAPPIRAALYSYVLISACSTLFGNGTLASVPSSSVTRVKSFRVFICFTAIISCKVSKKKTKQERNLLFLDYFERLANNFVLRAITSERLKPILWLCITTCFTPLASSNDFNLILFVTETPSIFAAWS